MKKLAVYSLVSVLGFLVLMCGLIGFAHTPIGKPYLGSTVMKFYALLGASSGSSCPLGYDRQLSLEQRQSSRALLASSYLQKPMALSRELFEMKFEVTTRAEIEKWAKTQGGNCKSLKSPYEIECEGPFLQSASSTLWLEFDGKDRLVTSRGITKFNEASSASEFFENLQSKLKSQANKNFKLEGYSSPVELKKGLLNQAAMKADFKNLKATLRITNLGKDFAITHEYLAF